VLAELIAEHLALKFARIDDRSGNQNHSERAREKYPKAKPRIISDNGPQFIARDFKEFIRIAGMTHVRISPYYPQSNGKLERWHISLKSQCIRLGTPLTKEDARRLIQAYVDHYNTVRLHSAIGYVTPIYLTTGRNSRRTRSQARTSASPAAAPPGGGIDACTFFEHDYNDLAR